MRELLRDRVVIGLVVALVGLILLEALLISHYHPVFPWHHVPGYAAAIGVVGGAAVILLSRLLGRVLLRRSEGDE